MNSGTFHTTSQEWYYSSREKMVGHTVHLAQLPDDRVGQGVFIDSTPPTGTNGNNFSNVPPFAVPDFTPYGSVQWQGTTGYMGASFGGFGGFDFSTPIQDGLQDFSQATYDIKVSPSLNTQRVAFAAPSRLGGGMCLVQGILPSSNRGIGTQAIETHRLVMFTSQLPVVLDQSHYPPLDYTVIQESSNAFYGIGSRWSAPVPAPDLTVLDHPADSLFLIDNLTTGTSPAVGKYVGQDAAPEYPYADYLPIPGFFEVLWFGEKNP